MHLRISLFSISILLALSATIAEARPVTISQEPYQLGSRQGGALGSNKAKVTVSCMAVKSKKSDEYFYSFVIKNSGEDFFLFQFDLLNYVLSGRYNFPNVFDMPKGKTFTFTLTSKEAPILAGGYASMFRKNTTKGERKFLQYDMSLTVSGIDFWVLSPGSDFECPLPPSLLNPR